MTNKTIFQQFQELVYQSMLKRADVGLEFVNGLSSATTVDSPVAVSESVLFSRKYSSAYDWQTEGAFDEPELRKVLHTNQPSEATTIGGYEVYAVDCTEDPHPEGKTLADRHQCRKGKGAPLIVGHRYSWVVRLLEPRTSWCFPQDVERVPTASTDSLVAGEQTQRLDGQSEQWKVLVADSLYSNAAFLAIVLTLQTIYVLLRVRTNRVLYEKPPERKPRQKGRPRKHGDKFKVSAPPRAADRCETITIWGQSVRLQIWHGLHFRQVAALVGSIVWVEFLKSDGTRRFKRPMSLFWSGPDETPLADICQMYLWRFAIEHMFRFLKQHCGLTTNKSPNLTGKQQWMWSCALAMCQLALLRHLVADKRPAWHPKERNGQPLPMTPRQVQRAALSFLFSLDSPVQALKPSGKGSGRALGYSPEPRPRFDVVKKGKKGSKKR